MQKTSRGSCPTWRQGKTYYFPLIKSPTAVGGGEGGGTLLQVPGLVAILSGAADGDGVDAVGVAVAGAVVTFSAAVPRRPDENGPQAPAALWGERGQGVRGGICLSRVRGYLGTGRRGQPSLALGCCC